MSEQKPDGYVIWHPEKGVKQSSLANTIVECQRKYMTIARSKNSWNVLLTNGWRVRPVKLVFLDEEEKWEK